MRGAMTSQRQGSAATNGAAVTMAAAATAAVAAGVIAVGGGACTPKVTLDSTIPEAMEFDPQASPPRVPEPTLVLLDPMTGHLDFGRAGITVPDDCAAPGPMPQAQCEFYHYLETL